MVDTSSGAVSKRDQSVASNRLEADKSVSEQLIDVLSQKALQISDLFRHRSGKVTLAEFHRVLAELECRVPPAEIDALFYDLDPDGSGALELKELEKLLRQGSTAPPPDDQLLAGGAGEIETSSSNKHPLRKGGAGEGSALRFDIDEDSDKSVAEQLRDALASASVRVIDLFNDWDDDQSGTVSRKEFHKAMAELEFNVPKEAIDELFAEWDPDGSGALELKELQKLLRRGSAVRLDTKLQAGAAGKIETSRGNKHAVRKGPAGEGSSIKFDIDEDSDKSVAEQLRDALIENSVRIIDLFNDWDDDHNGKVTRDEFHKAMAQLQFEVPAEAIDVLFAEWDPDGSGALELKELQKLLRRGSAVRLDTKLQAGAAGKIETSRGNKHALRGGPPARKVAPSAPPISPDLPRLSPCPPETPRCDHPRSPARSRLHLPRCAGRAAARRAHGARAARRRVGPAQPRGGQSPAAPPPLARRSWWKVPSTLVDHSAPTLGCLVPPGGLGRSCGARERRLGYEGACRTRRSSPRRAPKVRACPCPPRPGKASCARPPSRTCSAPASACPAPTACRRWQRRRVGGCRR